MWLFDEATKKFFLSPDGTNRHICADIIVKSNAFLGQHMRQSIHAQEIKKETARPVRKLRRI
jgi:hypothetical protein